MLEYSEIQIYIVGITKKLLAEWSAANRKGLPSIF